MLSRAELASVLLAARRNPRPFIEGSLHLKDTKRVVRKFEFNYPQGLVHEAQQKQRDAERPVRSLVLKARKEGVSTKTAGDCTTYMLSHPGARGLVMAHEREASEDALIDMYRVMYENLPDWLPIDNDKKPITLDSVRFGWIMCSDGPVNIDSEIVVDTGTKREVGRSKTLHFLHISEAAFFVDLNTTLTGLLEAVPEEDPDTVVIIESTANGMVGPGAAFKERWDLAEAGGTEYDAIFLPWFILPEKRATAPTHFEPTQEEEELAKTYGLEPDQLWWRRQTIANKHNGDVDKFRQENPATAEEAFIVTGQRAFSASILVEYQRAAKNVTFTDGEFNRPAEGPVLFIPRVKGRWRIFEPVQPGHEYQMGADTALGIEDCDLSAAAVLDRTTTRFVASFLGTIDPRVYAHELAKAGYYYNDATIAPEVNPGGGGLTVMSELVDQLRYRRIYRWRVYDNVSRKWTQKMGWYTSWASRPMLVNDFSFGLRQHLVGIPDLRAIKQLIEFDAGQERPGKDDLAMAQLIAYHTHLVSPLLNGQIPRAFVEAPAEIVGEPPPVLDPMSQEAWDSVDRLMKRLARKDDDTGLYGIPYAEKDRDPWPEIEY